MEKDGLPPVSKDFVYSFRDGVIVCIRGKSASEDFMKSISHDGIEMGKFFFSHLLVFILAFADDFFDLLIDFINRLRFFVVHFDGLLARQKLVSRKAHGKSMQSCLQGARLRSCRVVPEWRLQQHRIQRLPTTRRGT